MPYGFGLTACAKAKCQEQILAPRQHRDGLRDPGWQVIDALGEKQGTLVECRDACPDRSADVIQAGLMTNCKSSKLLISEANAGLAQR
jgi:hypothetical protein